VDSYYCLIHFYKRGEMVRVVFLHPDLGIGGAERLVVDMSLALQSQGHETTFLTAHHDPGHCFPETLPGGGCRVLVGGTWLPKDILGRCKALCANLRMLYLTLYMLLCLSCDLVIVDQVSSPLLLTWLVSKPSLFYCHFPDLLLSPNRSGLKVLYRAPLDWLEEVTTGLAHTILVNSNFTKEVFRQTFTRISEEVSVLYPSLPVQVFQQEGLRPPSVPVWHSGTTFLSINRFERKKNIGLAIDALSQLSPAALEKSRLIIAGGFDLNNNENIQHYSELEKFARIKGVSEKVIFLKSPSDSEKVWLLKNSSLLVYTPAGEHFGIVPLEAMYCLLPVLARNCGGPTETVVPQVTGWLEEEEGFTRVLESVAKGEQDIQVMGRQGSSRVNRLFSFQAFTQRLEMHALSTIEEVEKKSRKGSSIAASFALAFHFGLAIFVLYWMIFQPLPTT